MTSAYEETARTFARATVPLHDQAPKIPILSPRPFVPVRVILLGDQFEGFFIHWIANRSRPCIEPRSVCEGCLASLPRRWKGFCQAFSPPMSRLVICECTAECVRRLPILTNRRQSLVGMQIMIERIGSARNGPCRAVFEPAKHDVTNIGSFHLGRALARIWGLDPGLYGEHDAAQVRASDVVASPLVYGKDGAK